MLAIVTSNSFLLHQLVKGCHVGKHFVSLTLLITCWELANKIITLHFFEISKTCLRDWYYISEHNHLAAKLLAAMLTWVCHHVFTSCQTVKGYHISFACKRISPFIVKISSISFKGNTISLYKPIWHWQ